MLSFLCLLILSQTSPAEHPLPMIEVMARFQPPNHRNLGSQPNRFTAFGDRVYFQAGPPSRRQLYQTDGHTVLPVLLTHGAAFVDLDDHDLLVRGNALYFSTFGADQDDQNRELWRVDPANGTPRLVLSHQNGDRLVLLETARGVLIARLNLNHCELFLDRGDQVVPVAELPPALHGHGRRPNQYANPYDFQAVVVEGRVYFTAYDADWHLRLWRLEEEGVTPLFLMNSYNAANPLPRNWSLHAFQGKVAMLWGAATNQFTDWRVSLYDTHQGTVEDVFHALTIPSQIQLFSQSLVVDQNLIFNWSNTGLRRYDGVALTDMAVDFQGIDDDPNQKLFAGDHGFYLSRRSFDPATSATNPLLLWVDLKTPGVEQLAYFEDALLEDLRLHEGRLLFRVYSRTTDLSDLWTSDNTPAGTLPLTQAQFHNDFDILGDRIFFGLSDLVHGWEPRVLQNGEITLLTDLDTRPLDPMPQRFFPVSGDRQFLLEADRLQEIRDGVLLPPMDLSDLNPSALTTSGERVYLLADAQRDLYQLTPDGPTFLARVPGNLLYFNRIYTFGEHTLVTASREGTHQPPSFEGLGDRLFELDGDGELNPLNPQFDLEPGLEVTFLDGDPVFGESVAGRQTHIIRIREGQREQLAVIRKQGAPARVRLLTQSSEALWYGVYDHINVGGPDPFRVILSLAKVTGTDTEFSRLGRLSGSHRLNGRYVFVTDQVLRVLDPEQGPMFLLARDFDGASPAIKPVQASADHVDVYYGSATTFFRTATFLSDGTAEGTFHLLEGYNDLTYWGEVDGRYLVSFGNPATFHAIDAMGTLPIPLDPELTATTNTFSQAVRYGDALYLAATTKAHGLELCQFRDGVLKRITELAPGPLDGNPFGFRATDEGLYFFAPSQEEAGLVLYRLTHPEDSQEPEEPMVTVTLDAPHDLRAFRIGVARLPGLPEDARVGWTVLGGSRVQIPQPDALVFKVGGGPQTVLTATITLADGRVMTVSHTIQIQPR